MTTPAATSRQAPQDHEFERELVPTQPSPEHLTHEDLKEVRLHVSADLGSCSLTVREVLKLRRGSVLTLNKLAGETADILVNGVVIAKGEVVVLGDMLHVRVAEIQGMVERDPAHHE